MDELLAKATQGVDMDAPGAFLHVLINLMGMIPWTALFWWNLVFIVVGVLLGWWRGRVLAGLVWALVLGPIGWVVVLLMPRSAKPPPLPR
ncbi:hypothetical protein ISP15_01255 [Dyella jejuensis]|uniref:Uncharacterized protein n=1 Tax=Dyella jejuensis TaxID=1432009 RepID=A0ABW8JD01_9GAMM